MAKKPRVQALSQGARQLIMRMKRDIEKDIQGGPVRQKEANKGSRATWGGKKRPKAY